MLVAIMPPPALQKTLTRIRGIEIRQPMSVADAHRSLRLAETRLVILDPAGLREDIFEAFLDCIVASGASLVLYGSLGSVFCARSVRAAKTMSIEIILSNFATDERLRRPPHARRRHSGRWHYLTVHRPGKRRFSCTICEATLSGPVDNTDKVAVARTPVTRAPYQLHSSCARVFSHVELTSAIGCPDRCSSWLAVSNNAQSVPTTTKSITERIRSRPLR
jgi:hypothetical protein